MTMERPADTEGGAHWRTLPPNAHRSHTSDRATEDGACGVAILLAKELSGHVVLCRSERKEGRDYWLGPPDYPIRNGLKGMSRIEVSGIRKISADFRNRCELKRRQIGNLNHQADKYVSVVEFGTPRAIFERV